MKPSVMSALAVMVFSVCCLTHETGYHPGGYVEGVQSPEGLSRYCVSERIVVENLNDFGLMNLSMNVSVFRDTPFQNVSLRSNPGYEGTYFDGVGNRFIRYGFDGIESGGVGEIFIEYEAEVSSNEFLSLTGFPVDGGSMGASELIQSDAYEIRRQSRILAGGLGDRLRDVERIYEFVSENISYTRDVVEDDALWVLRNRRGNCESFANLFIALCRASGIPAIKVEGYVIGVNNTGHHAWALAYIRDRWVQVDATNRNFGDDSLYTAYITQRYVVDEGVSDVKLAFMHSSEAGDVRDLDVNISFELKRLCR